MKTNRCAFLLAATLAACSTPPAVPDAAGGADGGGADAAMSDAGGGDLSTPVKCSAASCNGCCDGNTCQPGGTASACGLGGGACAVCPHTAACTPAGMCVEMLDGMYSLVLDSASIAVRKGSGECWDPEPPCGLPDVYARLWGSGEKTPVVPDTLSPHFTAPWTISYKDLTSGRTTFELSDVDDLTEERIGQGTLKPSDDEIRAGRVVISTAGFASSVTFTIRKM